MNTNNNHIKIYTAEDLANYWKGKMTNAEMHALEKASLDDPFLADALEGYADANENKTSNDIKWLKSQLTKPVQDKKAIPIFGFKLFRVAAMLLIVGGLATLSYFIFSNKTEKPNVAQVNPVEKKGTTTTDTTTAQNNNVSATTAQETTPEKNVANKKNIVVEKQVTNDAAILQDNIANLQKAPVQLPQPVFAEAQDHKIEKQKESAQAPVIVGRQDSVISIVQAFKKSNNPKKQQDGELSGKITGEQTNNMQDALQSNMQRSIAGISSGPVQNFSLSNNIILGKITDQRNEPIAGAIVKANNSNNTAYSDKDGNFQLAITDTTKTEKVTINSVGFEPATIALNNKQQNNIQLQENRQSLNDVVVTGYGVAKKKNITASTSKVSPDSIQASPLYGWNDYNIYLEKNKRSIENTKGEVVLRFSIDKKGKPTNIVVEKSLNEAADKEAIRLLKNGPKWNNTKSIATLHVTF